MEDRGDTVRNCPGEAGCTRAKGSMGPVRIIKYLDRIYPRELVSIYLSIIFLLKIIENGFLHLSFKAGLLRYHLHTIKFTHFKYMIP